MLLTSFLAWHWFDPRAQGLLVQGKATGVQMVSRAVWIRPFNVEWFVGVDGLSISMVLLTGIISFVAAIASMPWWQGGDKAIDWRGWTRTTTATATTSTTPSTSRCGWCPAT